MVDNDNDIEEGIITWSQTLERQTNMIIRSPFKNKQNVSIMVNIWTTQNKNKVQIVENKMTQSRWKKFKVNKLLNPKMKPKQNKN
jgi:hypothetical protein